VPLRVVCALLTVFSKQHMFTEALHDRATGTGRGVRIAIIDSGVHEGHPHVPGVAGGIGIDDDGGMSGDFVDHLGHGTAVTAAISEKAPDARLYAVRIFGSSLATNITSLVAAIDWAIRHRMHLINLSLGSSQPRHEEALRDAVEHATAAGVLIVAARDEDGMRWFPGSLPGVVSVRADASCPRDGFRIEREPDALVFCASPFPRPTPGLTVERRLTGSGFAVANMTGFVARTLEPDHARYTLADAIRALTCAPSSAREVYR
jgi:subtilisin family serine protease